MRFRTILLSILLILTWSEICLAHVHMDKSAPADGASLNIAPKTVQVWFSGKVAAEWSHIEVTNSKGERVDIGETKNGESTKHLIVELRPLPSGTYHVKLNVVSGDGHRVKGSFSFTVE